MNLTNCNIYLLNQLNDKQPPRKHGMNHEQRIYFCLALSDLCSTLDSIMIGFDELRAFLLSTPIDSRHYEYQCIENYLSFCENKPKRQIYHVDQLVINF